MNVKKIFFNPGIISAAVGLLMFSGSIMLPAPFYKVDELLGNIHMPLSMLVLGSRLSRIQVGRLFLEKMNWITSAEGLLLFPLMCTVVFWLMGARGTIPVIIVIAIASPAGAATTMFAIHYRNNPNLAVKLVSMQTLLSLITLPLLVPLAQQILV